MNHQESSNKQIENFHRQIVDLVKKYQFRDRHQILSCGISVSQCYILETLHTCGSLTVTELATKMYLKVSTVTRVVDQLVRKEYVSREEDLNDRRVRIMQLTELGEVVFQECWRNIFESERVILENFPAEHREMLIDFLRKLNQAVEQWHAHCHL